MSSEPSKTAVSHQGTDYQTVLAWAVFLAAFGTIAGAWGFELIGGYVPCQLCLGQRIPYYVGVPVALLAVIAAISGRQQLARLLLLIVAGIFVWGAFKGGFHAGVEWEWWQGPISCGGGGAAAPVAPVGNLLGQLTGGAPPVSCTVASWRFPDADWGLSFAGWNAVISVAIVIGALLGATRPIRAKA